MKKINLPFLKYIYILLLGILFTFNSKAQGNEEQLANQYYVNAEYDKASVLYEKLVGLNSNSGFLYDRLIDCYIKTNKLNEAENIAKKQHKKYEIVSQYEVDIYWIQLLKKIKDKSNKNFDKLLKNILPIEAEYEKYANSFIKRKLYIEAFKVYEKGRVELNNSRLFGIEIAKLYSLSGEKSKMFHEYLSVIEFNSIELEEIQGNLQAYITDSNDGALFKSILNSKIQNNPNSESLLEMLIWFSVQQRDFMGAFIQVRAIDKRLNLYGNRVIQLAQIAKNNHSYAAAGSMYQYVASLGKEYPNYYFAREMLIDIRYQQLNSGSFELKDLYVFEKECIDYLKSEGISTHTVNTVKLLAELEAFHLNKPDTAIKLLNHLLETVRMQPKFAADCKLLLGDIYIVVGEYYDPVLYYGQVDKDFSEDALGQEAKFRNARLSYYKGDFEWSQSQLDVLKTATSQLISNNSIELSLLIQDNTGLDSSEDAMKMYANAELLIYQNKFVEAQNKLDSIYNLFPQHSLSDEILYAKSKIFRKKHMWDSCIESLERIVTVYKNDILADNALFDAAEIYEINLNNREKAKELYEKLVNEYPGSVFAVEARKRYRILRGDINN